MHLNYQLKIIFHLKKWLDIVRPRQTKVYKGTNVISENKVKNRIKKHWVQA